MRVTSSYSIIVILAMFIGFGLVISKYAFLPNIGVAIVIISFFAPLYKDSLLKLPTKFEKNVGKREKNTISKLYDDILASKKLENNHNGNNHTEYTDYNISMIIILAMLGGFGLVLSKHSFLPSIGMVIVITSFFAPFYKDSLLKIFHHPYGNSKKIKNRQTRNVAYSHTEHQAITDKRQEIRAYEHKPISSIDIHKALSLGTDLHTLNFSDADLRGVSLIKADLSKMNLQNVNFAGADLSGAILRSANLSHTNLSGANLSGADLSEAYCAWTNLTGAKLDRANLNRTTLRNTSLNHAILTGSSVYGISVWDVDLENAIQSDLVITPPGEPKITIDNLKVAQFVSLLLNNKDLCDVVNTITAKVVFILGHFNLKRKSVLDALRNELRNHGYLLVVFDFDAFISKDITNEISALAHMSRFVIADIGDSENMFIELQQVVPSLYPIPIQPLLQSSLSESPMLEELKTYPWFLQPYIYKDIPDLLSSLEDRVIKPPENFYDKIHLQDGDSLTAT